MGLAYFFIGIGLCLLIFGLVISGPFASPPPAWKLILSGSALAGVWSALRQSLEDWQEERRGRKARTLESPLASMLTPQLFGDYTPYVVDAAGKLAQERDYTAVPALVLALENCVDTQRPGWRDRAEALAYALARVGDRRALPLLYRLENVRGIGLIPAIRHAITSIEPQTSLLRPGSVDDDLPVTLLRPARDGVKDDEPHLMLRAADSQER